jgi:hypothetical protein
VGPEFAIMFDRTASPGPTGNAISDGGVWSYETALKVARALEKHNACWLEEPFARGDYKTPARLAAEVDIRSRAAQILPGWTSSGNVSSTGPSTFSDRTRGTLLESPCAGKSEPWRRPSVRDALCMAAWR